MKNSGVFYKSGDTNSLVYLALFSTLFFNHQTPFVSCITTSHKTSPQVLGSGLHYASKLSYETESGLQENILTRNATFNDTYYVNVTKGDITSFTFPGQNNDVSLHTAAELL